jgi:hypothetical protein
MLLARQFLEVGGYACEDKSATESYDILARRGAVAMKIEVKGTTSDLCDSVLMTRNEIDLHQAEKGRTGLLIVSQIRLERTGAEPVATGGQVEAMLPWDIDQWTLEAVAFQVRRRASA